MDKMRWYLIENYRKNARSLAHTTATSGQIKNQLMYQGAPSKLKVNPISLNRARTMMVRYDVGHTPVEKLGWWSMRLKNKR